MSTAAASRDVWKQVALVAISLCLGLAGATAKTIHGAVDRGQVEQIVRADNPYLEDRGVIQAQLAAQTMAIEDLTGKVDELRITVAKLTVELRHR